MSAYVYLPASLFNFLPAYLSACMCVCVFVPMCAACMFCTKKLLLVKNQTVKLFSSLVFVVVVVVRFSDLRVQPFVIAANLNFLG